MIWNPREHVSSFHSSKLAPELLCPYSVISQERNDITCTHCHLKTQHTFHSDRVSPFLGAPTDAPKVGLIDKEEYFVLLPYTILARTYLRTASALQCSQTLDPFTVMHTYTDLCLAHSLETWTPFDIVVKSAYALLTMPVTYKRTNVVISPFIRYSGTSAYSICGSPTSSQLESPKDCWSSLQLARIWYLIKYMEPCWIVLEIKYFIRI